MRIALASLTTFSGSTWGRETTVVSSSRGNPFQREYPDGTVAIERLQGAGECVVPAAAGRYGVPVLLTAEECGAVRAWCPLARGLLDDCPPVLKAARLRRANQF